MCWVEPGCRPVTSSNSMMPTAQTSVRWSTTAAFICSGDI